MEGVLIMGYKYSKTPEAVYRACKICGELKNAHTDFYGYNGVHAPRASCKVCQFRAQLKLSSSKKVLDRINEQLNQEKEAEAECDRFDIFDQVDRSWDGDMAWLERN
jgi:hypothetical protein